MRHQYIVRFDGYDENQHVKAQVMTVIAESMAEVVCFVDCLCDEPLPDSLPSFARVDLLSIVRSPGGAIIGPVSEVRH